MQRQSNALTHTFTAGQDLQLAATQYKAIKLDGTIAVVATAAAAIGIVISKPGSGEDGTYVYMGITKARFGAAVNSGAAITVGASGFMTSYSQSAVASGTSIASAPIGRALVQVASGDIAECAVNFISGGLAP